MIKKNIITLIIVSVAIIALGAGFLVWKNYKDTAQQVQNQEQQKNEQEVIDTNDWKTYRDEKYKFEVKYPQYLIVVDNSTSSGGGVEFHQKNKDRSLLFDIHIINKQQWSLAEREIMNKGAQGEQVTTERIDFNGIPALKTKFGGNSQSPAINEIYFINDGKGFILSFTIGSSDNTTIISKDQDKIIFSFNFIKL